MGGLPFDRVVLGGHEPSHHLSAGILQQLGVETGRIFGIWNENAVSSFLAGTKVYPKDSYAYKSIGLHNRENFIKFNYYFLNLKHLSKINEFRDNNKVIIKNSQEKELWQKELNIIYPDADKNMINLVKAAQLLNKIGMKIDNSHSQILNLADYIVNGKKNIRIDGMLDGKKIFFEHGQIISVDDTTNDKNSILGIRQWEQNPQKITSQIVDLDKTINNVNEISRKARSSSQDIHLDEFRRIFYAGNDSELFAQLQKKYPGKNNGINPTQTLRQSIALDIAKYFDPDLKMNDVSNYKMTYHIEDYALQDICKDKEIYYLVSQVNNIYKELPMHVKRSNFYF